MRIDLAGQSRQAGLHQQPLLLFQFLFRPHAVPDLQRNRDGEKRDRIERDVRQPVRVRPALYQPEQVRRELAERLAQKLGIENDRYQHQVKRRSPVIFSFREKTVDAEIEERRKTPELVRLWRQSAQQSAQPSVPRQQGQGQMLAPEEGGKRNQNARQKS